jgi:tRNA(adenine34) deaminase
MNEKEKHIFYMSKALELANIARENEDVPVGAVIVQNGEIIGSGYNMVEKLKNPLAHAEILAINDAVKNIGYKHLFDTQIYVTLEPCSHCGGGIVLARIPEIFIGAKDPKSGACGSVGNIVQNEKLNHRSQIEFGILEDECSDILKIFFKNLRQRNKINNAKKYA